MSIALGIFFDGTNNNKDDGTDTQSNVARLYDLYRDDSSHEKLYIRGVGSSNKGGGFPDESKVTRAFGAAFGAEGDARIQWTAKKLKELRKKKDISCVDLFGFSRGAALARHFTHVLKPLGIPIRYLGIFDTVGSFGRPGDQYNCGFDLSIDESQIDRAFHITSFDEIRKNFDLTSLKKSKNHILGDHIVEVEDVGVHSDIGGGYGSGDVHGMKGHELAFISLRRMHDDAVKHGLPLDAITGFVPNSELKTQHENLHKMLKKYDSKNLYPIFKELRIYERSLPVLEYKEPRVKVPGIRNGNMAARHRMKREKDTLKRSIKYLKKRIELHYDQIEQLMSSADYGKFITASNTLRDKYIHVSHSPVNNTLGMMPQKDETMVNQEPIVFYKRQIFYG